MKRLLSTILLFLLPVTFLVSCTSKDSEINKITEGNTTTVTENTIEKEKEVNENKNAEISANNETVSTVENNIEDKSELKEDTATSKVDSIEEKVEENNLMGVVKALYESDGKLFVDIDKVEFYRGDEAINEAIKDGKAVYDEESQRYFVYDGYYLRNTEVVLKTFELNEDSQYYLCQYDVDPNTVENSATNVSVSRKQFVKYINKYSSYDTEGSTNRAKLFKIKVIGNTIVSIEKQYTP